jgi:desulfoferrodoxin (superoxide reductase-like protein)
MADLKELFQSAEMIYASSYCNIHGLWQGSKELKIA